MDDGMFYITIVQIVTNCIYLSTHRARHLKRVNCMQIVNSINVNFKKKVNKKFKSLASEKTRSEVVLEMHQQTLPITGTCWTYCGSGSRSPQ